MKRNLNFPILNFKGEEIKDENGNNQLMSDIVSLRLFAVGNSDSPASPVSREWFGVRRIFSATKKLSPSLQETAYHILFFLFHNFHK